MHLALVPPASAEPPTTTTTMDPSGEAVRSALLGDEGVLALALVVSFASGALAGQALWGRS